MTTLDKIAFLINESINTKQKLMKSSALSSIQKSADRIVSAMEVGNKLVFCGNGGSAADAQHLSAEFVSRFNFDRRALPALALTTDTSALTAIGNDYGFDKIFERQVQSVGNNGDVFVGISTSGNSQNIRLGAIAAKNKGMFTIGFGGLGGDIWDIFDLKIEVPSSQTARIQECHILIGHILCELVELSLCKETKN